MKNVREEIYRAIGRKQWGGKGKTAVSKASNIDEAAILSRFSSRKEKARRRKGERNDRRWRGRRTASRNDWQEKLSARMFFRARYNNFFHRPWDTYGENSSRPALFATIYFGISARRQHGQMGKISR